MSDALANILGNITERLEEITGHKNVWKALEKIESLKAENARYIKALKFYGARETYFMVEVFDKSDNRYHWRVPIETDKGEKAKQTLAQDNEKGEG